MRSAHIRHYRGAICPFTVAWPTGSISLQGVRRTRGRPRANTQGPPGGERWSATRRPGRRALKRRPRTGGRIPPSSRTGMFGEGSRACSMRDGPGRARRRWCAAGAPWTFVTRSVWCRSAGNQLGCRARSGDFPLRRSSVLTTVPVAESANIAMYKQLASASRFGEGQRSSQESPGILCDVRHSGVHHQITSEPHDCLRR